MTTDDQGTSPPTLEAVRAVWSRRKWLAIPAFLLPFAFVLGLIAFLPKIYRSTATVLVDRQQVPEQFVRPTVTSGLETRLQTISQEILSRSRLQDLITRFRLYEDLRRTQPEEALVERMRRDIQLDLRGADQAGRPGATIAFALSYLGTDPQTVAQVTNTLASFYIEENLKVRERQAAGTAQFLRVQLGDVKKRLDEHEGRVSDFRRRNMGSLPQQMDANLATLERLNLQLRLNGDGQARALGRRQTLALQLAEVTPVGGPAGSPDAAAAQLARLRQELAELRTRFSDKYPDVIRGKAEIALLERQLVEARDSPKAPEADPSPALDPQVRRLRQALAEVETEIGSLKGEEAQIRAALISYQRRIEETPKREQEFQELSRDYGSTKALYATLLSRYEEAQLAESMEQRQKGEQFRLLDSAIASSQPAAPNRDRVILVGLALSLGLAAGAVLLAERLDTSFHSVDELRAFTPVPVLASIPRIVSEADASRRRRRLWAGALSVAGGLVVTVTAAYVIAHGNESLVWQMAATRY